MSKSHLSRFSQMGKEIGREPSTFWQLGRGVSRGCHGTASFTAPGTQGSAGKIVIDTGNNQIGEVNRALPRPLIAGVIDSDNNRLAGAPMTLTIKQGSGNIGSQSSITVNTDSDGRVTTILTLGTQVHRR